MTRGHSIGPDNTEFVVVSFEGPDRYSLAGGLGVRVTNLSRTLADLGFPVHLFFVGDPLLPGEETAHDGMLTLHRWCQWISDFHPAGVYQGEYEKLHDFSESLPGYVVDRIVAPAAARDKLVVILGEDWHTAEAVCRLADLLRACGLRNGAVLFWNANNTFGFDRIDWPRLNQAATLTTVSRYMKQLMLGKGLGAFVIPNGIPQALLEDIDEVVVAKLRRRLDADLVLTKVARWDPDKRWHTAVEAAARLKADGLRVVLLARGGIEPHGEEVLQNASRLGLSVCEVHASGDSMDELIEAMNGSDGADMISIRSHCTQDVLRIVYRASDAVLANSAHEPFGLVALETMAAGGVAFTGGTGEDYAVPFHNAIVLETPDPGEVEGYVLHLEAHPRVKERIREGGSRTAARFTWDEAIANLLQKLEFRARIQSALEMPRFVSPRLVGVAAGEPTGPRDETRPRNGSAAVAGAGVS